LMNFRNKQKLIDEISDGSKQYKGQL